MNRIAVDIDEVLMPFVEPMANWRKLKMPDKQKYSYVYRDMFNISEKESRKMVAEFYKSQPFEMILPMRHAQKSLNVIRDHCDKLYIITGRQEYARTETEDWLDMHFPDIFDDVILTNSYTPREIYKPDICTSLNIGVMIDDNDMTCGMCKNAGIKAIHFAGYDGKNVYPWCHYDEDSVLSWKEVLEKLDIDVS